MIHQFNKKTRRAVCIRGNMCTLRLKITQRVPSSFRQLPHSSRFHHFTPSSSMSAHQPKFTGDPKSHPDSAFAESLTGSCLCGSITVTIKDKELFTKKRGHLCHCSNCRKSSGSFAAANLAIDEELVEVQDAKGTLKTYDDYNTGSGKKVGRVFCGVDGK